MKIKTYEKFAKGLILQTTKGQIKLDIFTDSIIRIVYTLNPDFSERESLMITGKALESVNWDVEENNEAITLYTDKIKINMDKDTAAFSYFDTNGNQLMTEPQIGGKELSPIKVEKTLFDNQTAVENEASADGMKARVKESRTIIDRDAYHGKLRFEWKQNEALYGLGSFEEGIMNYRNHHQYLYQQNMRVAVPCLVSTNGYGIVMDNYSFITYRDDVHGSYIWCDVCDELDYYFVYGPEFDQIIQGYRYLTGQVPMFPRWAFGYIQSKERYQTQQELVSVVEEFRRRRFPLDVIVLDWQSWEGNLWGQKTLDPARFPTPEKMMQKLHDLNAKLMISIWPNMNNDGSNRLEMKEQGFLLGNQSTYDAFNPEARKLYWKQANEGLFSKGIDAWWCDCTEPFEKDWFGRVKPEPEQRVLLNTNEAKKYIDPQYINAYSLLHSQGLYKGQRSVTDDKRVVNLTRSAYAGQQRYGTITWTGDITAKWSTLRKQIAEGLNFCMTGIPYWTNDIGGFFVSKREHAWFWDGDYNQGCEDLGYRELYTRWFQYGMFLPIARSHGTDTPREPWRFGEPGTIFYDTLVKYASLRYRLIPYIYSLAWQVSSEGYTLMRALPFDFKEDVNTYNVDDQYMFGPAFLVNPITTPMYYEKDSKKLEGVEKVRDLYLPSGCEWYDFWTGKKYGGGQEVSAPAPLETMPLYVKSGSIVPMGPKTQYTSEKPDGPIELRIYPGADGRFDLYNDAGDNYDYEKGEYKLIKIKWDDQDRKLSFSDWQGKGYVDMPEEIVFNVVLVAEDRGVDLLETKSFNKSIVYQGKALFYQF